MGEKEEFPGRGHGLNQVKGAELLQNARLAAAEARDTSQDESFAVLASFIADLAARVDELEAGNDGGEGPGV